MGAACAVDGRLVPRASAAAAPETVRNRRRFRWRAAALSSEVALGIGVMYPITGFRGGAPSARCWPVLDACRADR